MPRSDKLGRLPHGGANQLKPAPHESVCGVRLEIKGDNEQWKNMQIQAHAFLAFGHGFSRFTKSTLIIPGDSP